MTILISILLLVFWIICGIYAYGFYFAYFQNMFPNVSKINYKEDRIDAVFFGLYGPFALLSILVFRIYVYGLKFK